MKYMAIVMAALIAAPTLAEAAACAARPVVVKRLAETFGEGRVTAGLGGGGVIIETWANLETGSWTITITRPTGITCLVADGSAFVLTADPAPPEGDPT